MSYTNTHPPQISSQEYPNSYHYPNYHSNYPSQNNYHNNYPKQSYHPEEYQNHYQSTPQYQNYPQYTINKKAGLPSIDLPSIDDRPGLHQAYPTKSDHLLYPTESDRPGLQQAYPTKSDHLLYPTESDTLDVSNIHDR